MLRKKGRQREEGVWVKVGARSEEGVVNDMALYKGRIGQLCLSCVWRS